MTRTQSYPEPQRARRSWVGALLAVTTLGASAIGLAVIAQHGRTGSSPIGQTVLASSAMEAGPSRAQVERVLGLSGLTPEILAAAGCSAVDAANFVDAAIIYAGDHDAAVANSLDTLASARASVDVLAARVKSGSATDHDVNDLATAQRALTSAASSMATMQSDLVDDLRASFSQDEITICDQIRSRAFDGVPAAYGAHDFSQAELKDLRDALAQERFVARHGGQLDEDQLLVLATARAAPTVLSALTRSQLNLASITAAWNERLDTTGQ